MSTLTTPSAKAHERVTGRWVRDIQVSGKRDWFIYYGKMIVGSPIPFLFISFAVVAFMSRAGVEIAAWTCAALTMIYIGLDRTSRTREFNFFRIGADFFLLGLVLVGIATAIASDSIMDAIGTLGDLRWVVLLYAISYCWELFPGLNRVFMFMVSGGMIAALAALHRRRHSTRYRTSRCTFAERAIFHPDRIFRYDRGFRNRTRNDFTIHGRSPFTHGPKSIVQRTLSAVDRKPRFDSRDLLDISSRSLACCYSRPLGFAFDAR
ncbi:MAG: hypothetical protein V4692_14850 [Bdellovibrionota bacterium]